MTHQYKKAPTNRQLRVSEVIRQEVAQIFTKGEVFHPALEKFTFTVLDVKTSVDLKIATIFINPVDEKLDKDLIAALNVLAPEYRRKLCSRVQLKFIPQIRFEIDKHIDDRIHLEKLLDKISTNKM
jgi:ribosome-binding factor A